MSERIAVVTGAASGIGLAVAQALAADGVKVVMADINQEVGIAEAAKIGGLFVKADLSQRSDCKNLIEVTLARFGRIDILVKMPVSNISVRSKTSLKTSGISSCR